MYPVIQKKVIRDKATRWMVGGNSESKHILFFLHGFPDSPETFKDQFKFFDQDYLIIAPYLRGMDPEFLENIPVSRYTIKEQVLDFQEIINYYSPNGDHTVTVVAHDLGGPYGWQLASEMGTQRASLVALNAPSVAMMKYRLTNLHQLKKSWYAMFFQLPIVSEWVWNKFENLFLASMVEQGRSNEESPKGREFSSGLKIYRVCLFEIIKEVLPLESGKYNLGKCLVIWGNQDAYLETPTQGEINKMGGLITLRIIEGKHWMHQAQHEKINKYIANFLNSAKP